MLGSCIPLFNRLIRYLFRRNQLCINTAIVYMHRFYMYQAFTDGAKTERRFHRQVCLL